MTTPTISQTQYNDAIEQLEVKVAYQEHTIELLNEEIARQSKDIEQLRFTLEHVVKRLKAFEPSEIAKQSEARRARCPP